MVLLDEVSSGLDKTASGALSAVLLEESKGRTLLMVTHEQDIALLCTRVVMLDYGKVSV